MFGETQATRPGEEQTAEQETAFKKFKNWIIEAGGEFVENVNLESDEDVQRLLSAQKGFESQAYVSLRSGKDISKAIFVRGEARIVVILAPDFAQNISMDVYSQHGETWGKEKGAGNHDFVFSEAFGTLQRVLSNMK